MRHAKARLFGVVLILVSAALVYSDWQQLGSEGRYSLKLAAFGPVGVVSGLLNWYLMDPGFFGR
jgi:hypothetical protein